MTRKTGTTTTAPARRTRTRAAPQPAALDDTAPAAPQPSTTTTARNTPRLLPPGTDPVKQVIKWLEKCTACGRRPDDVFADWLQLVNACLDMEPQHARSLATTGQPAADPPEIAALWAEMRKTYPTPSGAKESYFDYFAHAFAILLAATRDACPDEWQDVLGQVYMAFGYPHTGLGQYFTPMSVARVMAMMTIPDGRAEVHERLKAAIAQSPAAQAALLAGQGLAGDLAHAWFIARVIPAAIEHYEPVTMSDPACGSGVLLIAGLAQFDRWMIQLGLVQASGQDVDRLCVDMCRANFKLYGINGTGMALVLAEAEALLAQHGAPAWAPPADVLPVAVPDQNQADNAEQPLGQQVLPFPDLTGDRRKAA